MTVELSNSISIFSILNNLASFRPSRRAQNSARKFEAMPIYRTQPEIHSPLWSLIMALAPAGPGLPLEEPSVLSLNQPRSVFVEKVLRLQPNVNKIYLLLRAPDAKSATKRLHSEVIGTELFRILRDKWGSKFDHFISTKVIAVPGDISSINLGVNESKLREEMFKEIDIVVNSAATTDFIERYDVAMCINTFGPFNVMSFAKRCDNIKLFLHISTAYVCGEGTRLILEKPFQMGETLKKTCNKLDINEEKRLMEEKSEELISQCASNEAITSTMKELGLKRAKLYGWPNTYVFTKAMGEMILGNFKGDLPLVIIRPTMISSTYKEPFPGWIEGVRTIDGAIVGYGKGKLTCFPGNPNSPLDVIPADMVVNAMVVAMVLHTNHHQTYDDDSGQKKTYDDDEANIYHVSSSLRNPLQFSDLHNIVYNYFTKNPWINKRSGERIKVGKVTVLSTANRYFLYMNIKYVLPLKVLCLVNTLSWQYFREVYVDLNRKIKFAMGLAELYKPYVFFKGIFDDTNLKKLRMAAKEEGIDPSLFNFDSKTIDWEDYIMNVHVPGLSTHVIKS
ncbi:Male sterility, NAD-binding protein [Corchorus capsularis]|uniref:Fatty acyl-CoA reductase n=1 Tax=Corchorus capsularis TaxID=210143 RepID=A0A1R3G806_COCAP|nr:Male sterility, NAD-binding protein [Corchorus capsularis]